MRALLRGGLRNVLPVGRAILVSLVVRHGGVGGRHWAGEGGSDEEAGSDKLTHDSHGVYVAVGLDLWVQ